MTAPDVALSAAQATVARPPVDAGAANVEATPAPTRRPAPSLTKAGWNETGGVVLASSLLLLAMTLPAFQNFFIGEDFIHPGLYYAHGQKFWRALLSPSDGIFFRPVVFANNLLWMLILPLDPLAHHIRNFAYTVVNLVLLHRVLGYLVASPVARVIGLLFFAVSKVHLTTIGYINVYDSIVMLMLPLATILCFLRFSAYHRVRDYVLGLVCCGLAIFTKDYGLVVTGVVVALAVFADRTPGPWRARARWWAPRLAALPTLVLVYLAVRYSVVGPLPSGNPVYSPGFDAEVTTRKLLVFTSTLWNVSFTDPGLSGAAGALGWLVRSMGGQGPWAPWLELPAYLAGMALLVGTLIVGRRASPAIFFAAAWVAAYFGPTLLTRNMQLYYGYEPLAGLAVLVALCLDGPSRRRPASEQPRLDVARSAWTDRFMSKLPTLSMLPKLWAVALVVIAANGFTSNYSSLYSWQDRANQSRLVWQTALEPHRGEPIETITFVTATASRLPVWQWTLTADYKGPMIPILLRRPDLEVRVADAGSISDGQASVDATHLMIDLDNGFGQFDPSQARRPVGDRRPRVDRLAPADVRAGYRFNAQPDGSSALVVYGRNLTSDSVVIFAGTPIQTTYASSGVVTAVVPPKLYQQPGPYAVSVQRGGMHSNSLDFRVTP